ncbi:sirohydrochlorin chelatase [Saccharothrix sp. S26]|uniref:sirohydrochlorin chelatase n=1 Tax=Saccharothrix sp. S26 TaxID=2907215 RepID=UPI001F2F03FC|nr:sirohydrochlorin chelatase [Saccharothrix sp. S26]MCE7001188.1 sirohydrochlorin chelatase [Saccharothrix sp. S26]
MLIAVAHGSRDPRSAAVVGDLVAALPGARPAFLDLSQPLLADVLADVGPGEAVVVPLLLGSAYHALVDIPEMVDAATARSPGLVVRVTDVIGSDPRVADAALARLAEVGVRPGDERLGVVLAGAGSSHASANAVVAELAERWEREHGWAGVRPAFATCAPDVTGAMAELRALGARRIAVASWFLAPGRLPDRVIAEARLAERHAVVAPPLGAHPAVVAAVHALYLTSHR